MENSSCIENCKGCSCSGVTEVHDLRDSWNWRDYLGMFLVRTGFKRMGYGISPGLYRFGESGPDSDVLVTANYKLTVDILRKELKGSNFWVLVLDTKNVNVWCAAGKGTFGTQELINKIESSRLDSLLSHRSLILPQLGAPGVAAHEVKARTGFRVVYGPVSAADLPEFLYNGKNADTEMRQVKFPVKERLILIPVEMRQNLFPVFLLACFLGLTPLFTGGGISGSGLVIALIGWVGGAFLGPVLLPWLPMRAFWIKGGVLGGCLGAVLGLTSIIDGAVRIGAGVLILFSVVSHILMNFTGCTTFTSQSGVERELRIGLPVQITALVAGAVLWILGYWKG